MPTPTAQANEPSPEASVRRWRVAMVGCVVVLVFAAALTSVTSYDTWVHLSLGRWIAEHGEVPRHNLLSHTMPDRSTVDHQWLFQLGLYGLWRLGGAGAAIVIKAMLLAMAFGLVAATACRKGASPLLAATVVLVAAFAARFRFTLRPQVVGFALLATQLYMLERWRAGRWRGLLALLPLQVLWANLHGSAVMGCALPLAYAAGESLRAVTSRRLRDMLPVPRPGRDLAVLWGVALALVPLTLANPNGARVLTEPFALAGVQAGSGLKEFLLDRATIPWAELWGRHVFFTVLAVLGLLSLAGSVVRRDVTEVGLFAGLLWAAMHSQRFVGLFAVAAAPIVARNLSGVGAAFGRLTGRANGRRRLGVLGSVVALACLYGCLEVAWRGATGEQPTGLGVAPGLFPEAETAFVQANYPTGRLFNEFEHGGYIAWRTRRAVSIDSRGLLAYDAAFVRAYVGAWSSIERWREVCGGREVSVALVARPQLQRHFRVDAGWVLAHQGDVCAVFVRSAAPPGPPIGSAGAQVEQATSAARADD